MQHRSYGVHNFSVNQCVFNVVKQMTPLPPHPFCLAAEPHSIILFLSGRSADAASVSPEQSAVLIMSENLHLL
jgi:hypothetical protein